MTMAFLVEWKNENIILLFFPFLRFTSLGEKQNEAHYFVFLLPRSVTYFLYDIVRNVRISATLIFLCAFFAPFFFLWILLFDFFFFVSSNVASTCVDVCACMYGYAREARHGQSI